jgi:hypothetical protein
MNDCIGFVLLGPMVIPHGDGHMGSVCQTNTTPAIPAVCSHRRTDKSKRPESHPTKECARACVLCLKTEPK